MNKNTDAAQWLRNIANEVEDNPTRWTKNCLARDAKGNQVKTFSENAVCWCAEGFIWRDKKYDLIGLFGGIIWHTNDALESPSEFVEWFRNLANSL